MSSTALTSIAALTYAMPPARGFRDLVEEFERTAGAGRLRCESLEQAYDDIALFRLGGTVIGLGYAELDEADGVTGAVLVLSVRSEGADAPALPPAAICEGLAHRVGTVSPPDAVLWLDRAEPFSADLFDAVVAEAAPALAAATARAEPADTGACENADTGSVADATSLPPAAESPRQTQATVNAPAEGSGANPAQTPGAGPARRQTDPRRPVLARPDPIRPANVTPDIPHPMLEELQRIRTALYMPEPAPPAPPMTHRLALCTVNGAVMVLCLPVGAALFTYNALGRGDFHQALRALSLTATVVGLADILLRTPPV